nr:hypothetical protein [uncultured Anaerocolumna sp.]
MDEFIKAMIEASIEQRKQMEKKGSTHTLNCSFDKDKVIEKEVKELAKTTKMLFDEHVKIGFTENQAMQIVTSILSKRN